MDARRRFNKRERASLFLAGGGRCENCGRELEAGYHADHIMPHSKGGPTDVINAQALCPKCNQEKGDRYVNTAAVEWPKHIILRPWQVDAWNEYRKSEKEDFLAVATPGAGKTYFAGFVAYNLLASREVEFVVIVCPTDHLRR